MNHSVLLLLFLPLVSFSQLDCNSTDPSSSGKCRNLYSSGNVEVEGKLKKGLRHGKFTTYYFTGVKQSEVKYKYGKMNGLYRSFHLNGALEKQYYVIDDLIQGDYKEYHDNGFVRAEGQMVDSVKVGIWNYKDPFGNLIETVNYDEEINKK